ncbi:mechanosensitive ion channel family protein [Labrys neptuniae]|uniref:mechanosensitive ion channel family protein n=1 Tax=Labrys neptuniae TaxID=376174 RepID=UPI0028900902|nr:mechanosensitive ion channel family protein [Labrys neptuniae]MDT3375743.1 mechanosensitive ion channel family protein [Labrys neptuniae]
MVDDPAFLPLLLIDLSGLAGIVVWHLQGRRRPRARLVVQLLFFSAMTALAACNGIWPHQLGANETTGLAAFVAKSARVLWWTHLAWAVIGLMHIYFALNRRPREAHLLQDLFVALAYLGVGLSILGFVFGAPVGTLVATSGVVAVILGLALQNTLGDVFSGIALTLGRSHAIGDWIVLSDGTEGRVVETNWRATNLVTGAHNLVVLPNSLLAKLSLTNLSRPDETHWISQNVRIAASQGPQDSIETLRAVLRSCEEILRDPVPIVALKSVDALAVEAELQFCVASPARRTPARNEVLDQLCRTYGADGLAFAPAVAFIQPAPTPIRSYPSTAAPGSPATGFRPGPRA